MVGVGVGLFFLLFLGLGIGIWLLTMGLDKNRITDYVRGRGGRIVSISWAPFGKGWFGERNDRIFEVVYYDASGNQHFATCKTSLWGGVYWTDDRVTHRKGRWFDTLSQMNEAGNPIIGQITPDDSEQTAQEFFRDETPPQERPLSPASTDIKSQEPSPILMDELRRLREENERLREQLRRGD